MYNINILLFDQFELLDAFGPAEIFGKDLDMFEVHYYSQYGGVVESAQNAKIITEEYRTHPEKKNVLLLPGGAGTRELVHYQEYIDYINDIARSSDYILCVCTGAALLAKTSIMNGKEATTNKRAFDWVISQNESVNWIRKARWVKDGNIYTSSGVSAGMDMSLGFIRDIEDEEKAKEISRRIEYIWNENSHDDPFEKYT